MVETIEFYDEEDLELPPPLTKRDVIQLTKVTKARPRAAQLVVGT